MIETTGGWPGAPPPVTPVAPGVADPPIVVSEGFTVEPQGRLVRPSQRPGLGIEINESEVKKHPFEQEIVLREFYSDGSVGDW